MTPTPRRPRRTLLAAVAAAALGVLGLGVAPAAAQEWRGWNIHAADYPNGIGMDAFTRMVGERTNNRIRMRTFHSARLGQQDQGIQQMRPRTLDLANFNLSPFNNLAPSTNVVTLPFLFRNVAHMQAAIDGPAGEAIARVAMALPSSGVARSSRGGSSPRGRVSSGAPGRDTYGTTLNSAVSRSAVASCSV